MLQTSPYAIVRPYGTNATSPALNIEGATQPVGGNWPGPPNEATKFPGRFEVDFVRAYRTV